MTPKQIEKIKKKIADIKRILATEKRKFGCYDDSRGLRYLPTKYFIQLGEFTSGLNYTRWFDKQFPDDGGFPEFLFERTIIYFKTGKIKEAELKAFQTFCSNPYWLNKFLGNPVTPLDMWHCSNLARPEYTDALEYSSKHPDLADFSLWLNNLISTNDFISRSNRYIEIYIKLKTETDKELRHYLVQHASTLVRGM